ncbi:MAG TPA: molybdopterin-dependent oxidoreductase, partial [Limnochordia bacterium]|nr:molybdopterin-dependent oxidoreductase [Limnochordia bacterium]
LGFPLWIRLAHFFNILFITLLMRSGIEIISAHPMFYWNDHCVPGREWLKFSRKRMPKDKLWTAEDEKVPYNSWIALPGRDNLGLGRYWHFLSAAGWLLVGLLYVVLLFTSPEWRRLIPTSWAIVPQAWSALIDYLHFRLPPETGVFNALQQLVYAGVIFVLSPLQILTGLAMSPAFTGRFPGYLRPFGGKQAARSLHFLGLVAFMLFTVVHVTMVVAHGLGSELAKIVLGVAHDPTAAQQRTALWLGLLGFAVVVAVHVWATRVSLNAPRRVQRAIQRLVDPLRHRLFHHLRSVQHYRSDQVTTSYVRPNGYPPQNPEYRALLGRDFAGWHFEVGGLVEKPLKLTLAELKGLPKATQITLHNCIQGWTQIVEWGGVPLSALLDRCGPLPKARYILFETFDEKATHPERGYFYGTLDLELARHDQTILAYEMNGKPLPVPFGAPLRLRIETQLGFKMTKWVRRMELIEDYRTIGEGNGGWREDYLNYSQSAPI